MIKFYRTALCPRCFLAQRALNKIIADHPDLAVETIEITRHAITGWSDGIRMVPALKIGDDILSGLLLDEPRMRRFIENHVQGKTL